MIVYSAAVVRYSISWACNLHVKIDHFFIPSNAIAVVIWIIYRQQGTILLTFTYRAITTCKINTFGKKGIQINNYSIDMIVRFAHANVFILPPMVTTGVRVYENTVFMMTTTCSCMQIPLCSVECN